MSGWQFIEIQHFLFHEKICVKFFHFYTVLYDDFSNLTYFEKLHENHSWTEKSLPKISTQSHEIFSNFSYFSMFQFCSLGRLSHEVGWKYQDVVETLEAKRKVKAEAFHKKKLADEKIATAVKKDAKLVKRIAKYQKVIEGYGYA